MEMRVLGRLVMTDDTDGGEMAGLCFDCCIRMASLCCVRKTNMH